MSCIRRRRTPRRSSRVRDTDWMLAVKTLQCFGAGMGTPCGGVVEADHAGLRGLGQKCSDRETIPLCTYHHRERTDLSGAFKNFTKATMRDWLDTRISLTVRLVELKLKGKAP